MPAAVTTTVLRLPQPNLSGWTLSGCAHCGGHEGERKVIRVAPGYRLVRTAMRCAIAELKCRNCRQKSYLVPTAA